MQERGCDGLGKQGFLKNPNEKRLEDSLLIGLLGRLDALSTAYALTGVVPGEQKAR